MSRWFAVIGTGCSAPGTMQPHLVADASAPCGRRSCRRGTRSGPCRGPSRRRRSPPLPVCVSVLDLRRPRRELRPRRTRCARRRPPRASATSGGVRTAGGRRRRAGGQPRRRARRPRQAATARCAASHVLRLTLRRAQTCASASTIGIREARRAGKQEAIAIVTSIATTPGERRPADSSLHVDRHAVRRAGRRRQDDPRGVQRRPDRPARRASPATQPAIAITTPTPRGTSGRMPGRPRPERAERADLPRPLGDRHRHDDRRRENDDHDEHRADEAEDPDVEQPHLPVEHRELAPVLDRDRDIPAACERRRRSAPRPRPPRSSGFKNTTRLRDRLRALQEPRDEADPAREIPVVQLLDLDVDQPLDDAVDGVQRPVRRRRHERHAVARPSRRERRPDRCRARCRRRRRPRGTCRTRPARTRASRAPRGPDPRRCPETAPTSSRSSPGRRSRSAAARPPRPDPARRSRARARAFGIPNSSVASSARPTARRSTTCRCPTLRIVPSLSASKDCAMKPPASAKAAKPKRHDRDHQRRCGAAGARGCARRERRRSRRPRPLRRRRRAAARRAARAPRRAGRASRRGTRRRATR